MALAPRMDATGRANPLMSSVECWVSNNRKSKPELARKRASLAMPAVVPTAVSPALSMSLTRFIQ